MEGWTPFAGAVLLYGHLQEAGVRKFGVALWAFRLRAFQLLLSWTYTFPPTFGYMCGFSSQGPHGGVFMGVSAMGVSDVATG